jgi:hypothetical protein
MTGESTSAVCEAAGVWPVRLTVGGVTGWSLWCAGDTDVLLARGGRVQLFPSPDAMLEALAAPEDDFTPLAVVGLGPDVLRRVATVPAASTNLDAAAAWFSRPDRPRTVGDCDRALTAINMATDIGATAGDPRLAEVVESDDLLPVVDVLTLGLTLLGDGSPYRDNPEAMVGVITPEAAAAVARLVELAAGHIEAR